MLIVKATMLVTMLVSSTDIAQIAKRVNPILFAFTQTKKGESFVQYSSLGTQVRLKFQFCI